MPRSLQSSRAVKPVPSTRPRTSPTRLSPPIRRSSFSARELMDTLQLTRIRAALTRIADGTYGECLNCEKTIGVKRLEALPSTPYCIDCQEKIEKGELEDPVRAA